MTRIGIFFDGTQNNMHNSKLRAQCESASDAVCSSIEKLIGAGTSYDNGLTNVARLHDAYMGKAIYIEGIGTQSGLADDTKGLALGIGGTGVIMKAQFTTSYWLLFSALASHLLNTVITRSYSPHAPEPTRRR